jgi:hypothetical protein
MPLMAAGEDSALNWTRGGHAAKFAGLRNKTARTNSVIFVRALYFWTLGIAVCLGAGAPRPFAPVHARERGLLLIRFSCVPSTGGSHKSTRRSFDPRNGLGPLITVSTGCSLSASCIEQQGVFRPGQGSVSLECEDRHCVCHIEAHRRTGPPAVRRFAFESECADGEQAERLLEEHCISAAGTTLVRTKM